jgi:hypothetical protein
MGIVPCIRSCVFLHIIIFKLYSPHLGLDADWMQKAQLLSYHNQPIQSIRLNKKPERQILFEDGEKAQTQL